MNKYHQLEGYYWFSICWKIICVFLLYSSFNLGNVAISRSFPTEKSIHLESSVMWRPFSKYVYPPGVPAVLEEDDQNRIFKIEQYYNKKVDADFIKVYVRGPWHKGMMQVYMDEWRNEFLSIAKPVCDDQASFDENGAFLGYRCIASLEIEGDIPTGALGVAMAYIAGQGEVIHPNAVFWIILPETRQKQVLEPMLDVKQEQLFPSVNEGVFFFNLNKKVEKKVLRISKDGGYTIGSGFIANELGPLVSIFPSQYQLKDLPCGGVFIVTAAHLFPSGFLSNNGADSFGGFKRDDSHFTQNNVFNIQFNGSDLYQGAATLLAKNVESDVAILYLNSIGLPAAMKEQDVRYCHEIEGLNFSSQIFGGNQLRILGFTSGAGAKLVSKEGYLAEYPTEDTSNFGPITKIKIKHQAGYTGVLAEDGMSGGPIVTESGDVAGISIERPVTGNSLIGLDFTSIDATEGYDYFRMHQNDPGCVLGFNPFDRTLNLVNSDELSCNYGGFGSRGPLNSLKGEWVFQEVLAIANENTGREETTRGSHSWKNGHSIINGFTIIDGKSVVKSKSSIVVNRSNIEMINSTQMRQGFRLDKKSWLALVPVGVRILYSSVPVPGYESRGEGGRNLSSIISAVRNSKDETGFSPIYSLRNFVIWLRQQVSVGVFEDDICFMGQECK